MTKNCECEICNATEFDILEQMMDLFEGSPED